MRSLMNRAKIWLISTATGGTVLVLEGCDPAVRDTVIGGVEGASTTLVTSLIQAFFESLLAPEDDGTVTTVKAIVESLPQFFA